MDLLTVANPKIIELLIDYAIPNRNTIILAFLAFLLLAVPALIGILGIAKDYLDVALSQHIMDDLRVKLYKHLQQLSLRFYINERTGEITSRLTNDVNGVQDIVKNTLSQTISNIIKIILVLVLMFSMNALLTLLCLVLVPFFLYLSRFVGKAFRKVTLQRQEMLADVMAHLEQTLSINGVLLVKSFGRQQDEVKRLKGMSKQLVEVQIRQTMLGRWFMLTLHIAFAAVPALIYYFGGLQVIGGTLQLGQLVAFIAFQGILFPAFRSLLDLHVGLQEALVLFERLFAYLDQPVEIWEHPNALDLPGVNGHIRFRHVSFQYQSERPVLQDIDFEIQPGQLVALVGPSGAGKTTMTYLLARLYDVDNGSVEIDDHDVRSLTLGCLTRHIGMVTQESYLLHASVRENLLYGCPEATEERMIAAAQMACIHERILELPEGYDTIVGPRGYTLSGGEKQRIAIARVLLKDPQILILDEATSSLDTHSERLIQAALTRLQQDRTTLAIAHRLSTVLAADQIIVLERGQIVERGTHMELLQQGEFYARLYAEQFGEQAPVQDGLLKKTL
jgi:ATP-binding cassette subfamily B protein